MTLAPGASIGEGDAFALLSCSGGCVGTFAEAVLPGGFEIEYAENAVSVYAAHLPTGTEDPLTPLATALHPPWPNPARGTLRVVFQLSEPGPVSVAVYDVMGRRIAVLANGHRSAGRHEAAWQTGPLASGLYVVRLETNQGPRTRSVVVQP